MGIKQFIFKIILYLIIIVCMILPIEIHKLLSFSVNFDEINGYEIYVSINKSKSKTKKYKILLLGDSVGRQLYNNEKEHDDIYSLACNQAISMAGQYFLLHNYFEYNRDSLPEKVILLCTPLTLSNNLDKYAYHYFLKPFYTNEYKQLFSEPLISRVKQIPFYWTTQFPLIKTSNYSVNYELGKGDYEVVSPITRYYLNKIIDECKINNIGFQIFSTPSKKSRKSYIEHKYSKAIICHEFENIRFDFSGFFNSFIFLPDSCFVDDVHFKNDYIPSDYLKLKK